MTALRDKDIDLSASSRMSPSRALELLRGAEISQLMERADAVRRAHHGNNAYFVHSLNLNPTNVCENRCELCAFWRETDAPDAYMLSLEHARKRLLDARKMNLTEVHIVGGLTPELDLQYYESLITLCKETLPSVFVQGMTAVEIAYLAEREKLSHEVVIKRLKDAGLGAIPGGGAEIFEEQTRNCICSTKISAEEWLSIHETAHNNGISTNVTMLFGHVETDEQIIDHLSRIRDLQDKTKGFQALIPLPFHPAGTSMEKLHGPGGYRITRIVAVSRLFLDNVPHIRVLANYVDIKLLQVLSHSGVDDFGGTSLDERIARAAGAPESHKIDSVEEMNLFLENLGLVPLLVNSIYDIQGEHGSARISSELSRSDRFGDERLAICLSRCEGHERLTQDDAVILHDLAGLQQLGRLAHDECRRKVPGDAVTFVIDRNISITNICDSKCDFCAFHVDAESERAFCLTIDQICEKVTQAVAAGATQVLLQGGLNPALDLSFYEKMLSVIKKHTDVWLHSLSPTEIVYLSSQSGLSQKAVLKRLIDAGLDSLPGGGAEILVDEVRQRVSPHKIGADQWLDVMRLAHELGLKATATMVYGLGETTRQRIEHLMKVRDLQDETGGFTAFIPWSFQPRRTRLNIEPQSGVDYLRLLAVARLVLDNVPHIQAGWVTEGPDLAQLALSFGADDFGGVLMEEKVVKATGLSYTVSVDQVIRLIRETGMRPVQRTTQYERVKEY